MKQLKTIATLVALALGFTAPSIATASTLGQCTQNVDKRQSSQAMT